MSARQPARLLPPSLAAARRSLAALCSKPPRASASALPALSLVSPSALSLFFGPQPSPALLLAPSVASRRAEAPPSHASCSDRPAPPCRLAPFPDYSAFRLPLRSHPPLSYWFALCPPRFFLTRLSPHAPASPIPTARCFSSSVVLALS